MLNIDLDKFLDLFIYHKDEPLIFSSGLFLFLFTFFLGIYSFVYKNHRSKIIFVTLFSLYFYYKSSGIYFLLLIFSTVVDYSLANLIFKIEKRFLKKTILIVSLILNLGLLFYFKYTNFLFESFYQLFGGKLQTFDIFLPVGVSFFTFQSLSYTIDIYRGTLKPVKNIFDYAFFVTFFPQLVAGPIVRAVDFIPQIYKPVIVTKDMIGKAVFLISTGLIKKTVIADYISINFVDRIFDNPLLYSGLENLIGVYGYALQIYCDFSGYSDMAIGIALLMGFHFNVNFDSSYKSINITEFWRRWHISLSTWLKDYLYISMGGNRKGKIRTYFNLFITMLLGGLWHGAGIRFIIWGGLHGIALTIHKFFMGTFKSENNNLFIKSISWVITFHFVCFCWIFFRAENMKIVGDLLYQISYKFNGKIFWEFIQGYKVVFILIIIGYILHFKPKKIKNKIELIIIESPLLLKIFFVLLVIFIVVQFKSSEIQPFIYFQF
jgi:alginate O-acetyltransferase complex protein AlgI